MNAFTSALATQDPASNLVPLHSLHLDVVRVLREKQRQQPAFYAFVSRLLAGTASADDTIHEIEVQLFHERFPSAMPPHR